MSRSTDRSLPRALADPRFQAILWLVAGGLGWAGVLALGAALQSAGELGFDLELVLEAGRRVASGQSPYDPRVVAGVQLEAVDLFYSYPPPIGQAAALVAGLPSTFLLATFGLLAVVAFTLVAARIAAAAGELGARESVVSIVLPVLGVLPFVYPMSVALLFGNVDAWYPALYGLVLLGVLPGSSRAAAIAGGVALAVMVVAKLHPASLGIWLVIRALRDRSAARMAGAAALALAAIAGSSLALLGAAPWQDYLAVVRTASAAEIVGRLNIGPASQLALLAGGSESLARVLQLGVLALALAATAWAAWRRTDVVESLGVATVASLVVLPVTWFHYPVAVLPFAVAAHARARGTSRSTKVSPLLAAAAVIAAVSILQPVAVWVGVVLVLLAIRHSTGAPSVSG